MAPGSDLARAACCTPVQSVKRYFQTSRSVSAICCPAVNCMDALRFASTSASDFRQVVAATTVARTPWTVRAVSRLHRRSTPSAQPRARHAFGASCAFGRARGPCLAMTRGRDRKISDRDRTRGGRSSPRRLIAIGGRSAKVVSPPLPCRSWTSRAGAACSALEVARAPDRARRGVVAAPRRVHGGVDAAVQRAAGRADATLL